MGPSAPRTARQAGKGKFDVRSILRSAGAHGTLAFAFVLTTAAAAVATPTNFSFRGTIGADDGVQLITFTASGTANITLRSFGYAGGTQADGSVISRGGFDPILALFGSAGSLVARVDDDSSQPLLPFETVTGKRYDTRYSAILAAGSYTLAITQYDNWANGPTLADGFARTGQPSFTGALGHCSNGQFCDVSNVPAGNNRTNFWAFDILGAETATVIPEPSTALLVAVGVGALSARQRRARR